MISQQEEQKIFYIDAHTHLQDYANDDEILQILNESEIANLKYLGIKKNNDQIFNYLPKIILSNPTKVKIIPCIGLHPWYILENINITEYFQTMEQILASNPMVQVGEIGLDFLKAKEKSQKDIQKELFIKQMEIAVKYERTASVHCVRAHGEMLKLFKQFFLKNRNYNNAIIMHSYGGQVEIINSLDKIYPNFYYSFSMNIINKPEILKSVDRQKILFETDAPYQFRPEAIQNQYDFKKFKENIASEPKFIIDLIQKVSPILELNNFETQKLVMNNFMKAFQKFI